MSLIVPCSQQCDFFKKIDYKLKVITWVNKKIAQIHRYVSVLLVNIVIQVLLNYLAFSTKIKACFLMS